MQSIRHYYAVLISRSGNGTNGWYRRKQHYVVIKTVYGNGDGEFGKAKTM